MGHTVPDIATDAAPNGAAPALRAPGPDALDAVVDLLPAVFLAAPPISPLPPAAPPHRAPPRHPHPA